MARRVDLLSMPVSDGNDGVLKAEDPYQRFNRIPPRRLTRTRQLFAGVYSQEESVSDEGTGRGE